jgi:hypothetical protein
MDVVCAEPEREASQHMNGKVIMDWPDPTGKNQGRHLMPVTRRAKRRSRGERTTGSVPSHGHPERTVTRGEPCQSQRGREPRQIPAAFRSRRMRSAHNRTQSVHETEPTPSVHETQPHAWTAICSRNGNGAPAGQCQQWARRSVTGEHNRDGGGAEQKQPATRPVAAELRAEASLTALA